MTGSRKTIAVVCAFLLVFCACAAVPQIKERQGFSSPEAALKHIAAQIPDDIVLQALANIQVTTREGRYSLRLAILLKKPASLRVEAIPPFGPPTFFLSISDQVLKVFLTENNTFYIGHASRDNIARYVPLRLDSEEIISVLMGTGPRLCGQNTLLGGRPQGERYRVDIQDSLKRQSLWVRMTDRFLEDLEVSQDQENSYRVHYEEPLRIDGPILPQKITIVFEGENNAVLSIRFFDVQILRQWDPSIFDIKAPPGITPVHLD